MLPLPGRLRIAQARARLGRGIAASLGYRKVSRFSFAFELWSGKTPRAFRNQLLAQQGDCPGDILGMSLRSV